MRSNSRKRNAVNFRCGTVAIVGRPNAGKSTLLNEIIGEKVTIVSRIPQTTRTRIRGIYNDERGQIIFIDTPGWVVGKDKMDGLLKRAAMGTMGDVDCIIHLVDSNEPVGEEENQIVDRLRTVRLPIILGLNKVDKKVKNMDQYIALWEQAIGEGIKDSKKFFILPLSGKSGQNRDKLINFLFEFLPIGEPLYPTDTISDVPRKIVIADIIREKLFGILRQELPHAVAVIVENIEQRRGKTLHIDAIIFVEKDSQKGMVVGKNGQLLKKIGTLAREELEFILETKIYLELQVKTQKKWRDDDRLLEEMGLDL